MQRLIKRSSFVYSAFLLLIIALSIILLSLGYRLIVYNEIIWFAINTAAGGMLTTLCITKRKQATKSAYGVAQLLPFLALIYICVTRFLIDGVSDLILILDAMLCFLYCYLVSLLYTNKRVFSHVCAVLNSILLLFLITGFLLHMTFGQIGQSTIIRQELSPDKAYTAILVDSNQGATGGNTIVNTKYNHSTIPVGFGQFEKTKRLYIGDWGEFENMRLEWKDANTLLINGKSYNID